MLNNYHDEPAIHAEAMSIADDLGISRSLTIRLFNIFDPARVIEELTTLQK